MSLPQWDREDDGHLEDVRDGLAIPYHWPTPGHDAQLKLEDPFNIDDLRQHRRWAAMDHAAILVSSNPMCACGYTPFHWDLAMAIFKINPDRWGDAWDLVNRHIEEVRSWQ